jgi:hypothetical protein
MIYSKQTILQEFLKDPVLTEKYNISEEDLQNFQYGSNSEHYIIEFLQELIELGGEKDTNESRLPGRFLNYVKTKLTNI